MDYRCPLLPATLTGCETQYALRLGRKTKLRKGMISAGCWAGSPSEIAPSTNARRFRHWRFRFLFRVNNIPAIYTVQISRDAIASAQNCLLDAVLKRCVRDCRALEHLRSAAS
jgi:hypothetical protein